MSGRARRVAAVPLVTLVTFATRGVVAEPVCGQDPPGPMLAIDQAVEWLEPLVLEETDSALGETPRLSLDPNGGFIVTDARAGQVRIHGPRGELLVHFGREGDGPGEFRSVQAAVRLPDGRFCVLDRDGRLSVWSAEGELRSEARTGLRAVLSAGALGDSLVAVVTFPNLTDLERPEAPMIHLVEVPSGRVGEAFFAPPLTERNAMAAVTVEGSVAPVSGRSLGVTWTIFDSLWVVDLDARAATRRMELESARLDANRPPVDRRRDPGGFGEWLRSTTFPGPAWPAPGGGWLVTLDRLGPDGPVSGLLRTDAEGRRIWEVEEGPRLALVDPSGGILYFADPTGVAPGTFLRARERGR